MDSYIESKIEGGKLIKIWVKTDDGKISEIKICGDFFMHPEDAIEKLEQKLVNARGDEVSSIVNETLENTQLFGINTQSLTKIILEALK